MLRTLLILPIILLAAACGGDPDVVEQDSSDESKGKEQPAKEQGALLESGFGQQGEYVGLAAIVKNKSDHAGQTVTVSFNLLDKNGEVITTESQVDSFAWEGQELAVVTQAEAKQKVASVEATLLVEDEGTFDDSTSEDLGSADAKLVKGEYGDTVAKVKIVNPTDQILKNPEITVVCRDDDDKIAGSGFTFPDLIAPNGTFADEIDVLVAPSARKCHATLVPGLG